MYIQTNNKDITISIYTMEKNYYADGRGFFEIDNMSLIKYGYSLFDFNIGDKVIFIDECCDNTEYEYFISDVMQNEEKLRVEVIDIYGIMSETKLTRSQIIDGDYNFGTQTRPWNLQQFSNTYIQAALDGLPCMGLTICGLPENPTQYVLSADFELKNESLLEFMNRVAQRQWGVDNGTATLTEYKQFEWAYNDGCISLQEKQVLSNPISLYYEYDNQNSTVFNPEVKKSYKNNSSWCNAGQTLFYTMNIKAICGISLGDKISAEFQFCTTSYDVVGYIYKYQIIGNTNGQEYKVGVSVDGQEYKGSSINGYDTLGRMLKQHEKALQQGGLI